MARAFRGGRQANPLQSGGFGLITWTHKRLLALAGTLAAILAMAAGAAPARATIQLGVYTPGAPLNPQSLSGYGAMVGRQPDMVMWFRNFGEPLLGSVEAEHLRASGQTPMITWEPHTHSLAGLAAGAYDDYLHESAALARKWGGPLLLRLAHEMNGNWYPWGAAPATYLAAWRHVVALFRGDGAANVEWIWSPYVEVGGRFPVAPYFPGDHFIDYVGLDGYNWGSSRGKWQSLEEVFAESYLTVIALSHKPVILAEVSSSELGGDKATWIRAGFMTTIPRYFPRVGAVVWFNQVEKNDWRIDSSPGSLGAYRAVVNCYFYGGAGPCEGVPERARRRRRRRRRPKLCSFHVTRRVRRPAAAAVSYCLSQPAAVRIVIRTRGRSGLRASTVRRSRSGRNRVPLARILHRRRLRAGRYRVMIVARNRSGRSRRHRSRFRVLRSERPGERVSAARPPSSSGD